MHRFRRLVAAGASQPPANTKRPRRKKGCQEHHHRQLAGERLVIRFDQGEARMLTATSEKITLYQIPSAGATRYSNGNVELRGKGMEWTLTELGASTNLVSCKQYAAPKP
jgi:hypothetical protein